MKVKVKGLSQSSNGEFTESFTEPKGESRRLMMMRAHAGVNLEGTSGIGSKSTMHTDVGDDEANTHADRGNVIEEIVEVVKGLLFPEDEAARLAEFERHASLPDTTPLRLPVCHLRPVRIALRLHMFKSHPS